MLRYDANSYISVLISKRNMTRAFLLSFSTREESLISKEQILTDNFNWTATIIHMQDSVPYVSM
jgi:hypothetical protein